VIERRRRRATATATHGDVRVREATAADLETIVDLRLALLREYADHPVYGQLRPDARERAYSFYAAQLAAEDETILLAERGRNIVGIVRCVDIASSPMLEPPRYCYVSSAYVTPDARRSGVLRSLVRAVEIWARDRGLTELRLHNSSSSDTAIATWEALGFDVIEHVRRRVIG
jgi:ribosomal protein S18 acetylase RimI-like enzyme